MIANRNFVDLLLHLSRDAKAFEFGCSNIYDNLTVEPSCKPPFLVQLVGGRSSVRLRRPGHSTTLATRQSWGITSQASRAPSMIPIYPQQ